MTAELREALEVALAELVRSGGPLAGEGARSKLAVCTCMHYREDHLSGIGCTSYYCQCERFRWDRTADTYRDRPSLALADHIRRFMARDL